MLAPVRTVAPAALVSLEEAKRHLNVALGNTDDDDLIVALIASATSHLDGYAGILGRAIVTQTWRQSFCGFGGHFRLAIAPVASISSVKYFDTSNIEQTIADTVYTVHVDAIGPFVTLEPDQVWPSAYHRSDAVTIEYVAGQAAADVPPQIKTAITMLVAQWYETREATVADGAPVSMPLGVNALLDPLRRVGI